MIEIKPQRKLYSGYKLMEVYCNEKLISKGSDVITLDLNDKDYLKLDITEDGWIRIWIEGGKKIENKGRLNSLDSDFKLNEE